MKKSKPFQLKGESKMQTMKKLLTILAILFLLIPSLLFAQEQVARMNPYIAGSVPTVATCDSCTGALVASFHFEDSTNHNLTVGAPCGCSDDANKTYSLTGGSTYNTTYKTDGARGVNAQGEDDAVEYAQTTIDVTAVGTWCGDVYFTATSLTGRAFTIGVVGTLVYGAGDTNILQTVCGGSNYSGTTTFANNTWTRVCFSWDTSQAAGSDKLSNKVGASAWQAQTDFTLTQQANPATWFVVSGNFQFGRAYFDNIKIYNTYQAE